MRRTAVFAGTALVALVLLSLVVFHDALVAAAIRGVAAPLGYRVGFEQLQTSWSKAVASGTTVATRTGEPVFSAARIELHYSLRDLLPGSRHRFGLSALDIERPALVLIHHADGTYNVTLPAGTRAPTKPDTTPIDVRARIRDGSVVLIDRFVEPGRERRTRVVGIAVDASFAPHTHSFYNVRLALDDGHALHPVFGNGTFESARGFDAQHWFAADLPLAPLIDFALPSHAVALVAGDLRGLDARLYTFVKPDGTTDTHVNGRAQFTGGNLFVAALSEPVRDAAGTVRFYDNGLTTTGLDATLAGVPLHLVGGLYDLSAPQVHFLLTGRGELAALRQIAAAGRRLPLGGDLAFAFRAVGSALNPVVFGTFSAPALTYGAYRLDAPAAEIAVAGTRVDILGARLAYGPLVVGARGSLALDRAVTTDLVASVEGAGDALPYVGAVVPGLQLHAVAHVDGVGERLATDGIAYGSGAGGTLDALVRLDGAGNGAVGPLVIARRDGAALYARVALDRRTGSASGIVSVDRFSLLPAPRVTLPGIDPGALPAVAGTLDANLAGSVAGGRLDAASGHARLSGVRVGPFAGAADADIGGSHDGVQHARLHVATNVGTLDGTGTYDDGVIALDARLRASFDTIAQAIPKLAARGDIDIPLRAISDGSTVAAQIAGARFANARVAGVALRDADATVVAQNGNLDVRSARLGIAGGDVVAQGRIGDQSDLVAATSALDVRNLPGPAGLVSGGTIMARLRVRGRAQAPRADIGLIASGIRARGVDLAASALATYADGTLHVIHGTALAADSYATASGDVRRLGAGTPTLDVTANLRGAQIAALARVYPLPLRYPEGELDADVHATGAVTSPAIAADVRIPRGSINGLNVENAHVAVDGRLGNLAVRGGTVTVGTTTVTFDGALGETVQRLALRAPRVDLADFNDYFNAADTLGGRGSLAVDASASPAGIRTSGDVRFDDARFRRFAVGATDARWTTRGRVIAATADVRGAHGTARLVADATLPNSAPLRDAARRITLDATGTVGAFDLDAWLPAAGITLPVAGTLDATAHVHGAAATPVFALTAGVTNGVAAGYHLDALTLAANGDQRQARLTSLHVAGPGLVADASGSAGYTAHDPVALALHAQSDDLPTLERAAGLKLVVGGSLSTDLHVSGTRVAPRIAQTLDATNLSYAHYTIPRVHGDAVADEQTVQLNALEADLTKGRLLATATIPIAFAPPAIGLRNAPLQATLRAEAIDLAPFASALPDNSKLTGLLDGQLVASGTPHDPAIDGSIALTNGSYSSSLVRSAFTNARARLAFTRANAQLTDVHTDVGGGSIDGSAAAAFGDLRTLPRSLALNGSLTATNAGLNLNRYLRGKLNGTVTATKTAGERNTSIGGTLAFSQTRIPLTALLPSGKPNAQASAAPIPVAFALTVQAANDVRVQGAGVDIGARGAVTVGGTLAAPTLDGSLSSTDGSLSFYRTFTLQQGTVAFSPADGIIPNVDATATTSISNPSTDILLQITGPATSLNLQLSSNPSYNREQILGLLLNAQAFGAVSGVQTAQNSGGGISATNIAGGYLSGEFTQALLEPLGSQLGSSLGLSNLALGYDYGSGFSAGASHTLSKNLSATFHQTFGIDQRQIIGLNYALRDQAGLQFALFNAGNQSPNLITTGTFLGNQDPFTPANYALQAFQPPPGVAGYVLTYQRKYK